MIQAYRLFAQEGNRQEAVRDATGVGVFWKKIAAERKIRRGTSLLIKTYAQIDGMTRRRRSREPAGENERIYPLKRLIKIKAHFRVV